TPGEPQRDQAVVGIVRPILLEPLRIGNRDRLIVRLRLRGSVRKTSAQSGLAQRLQILIGMGGRSDVMAPIVHKGDAAGDRLGGSQSRPLVHVGRLVFLSERGGGPKVPE